MLKTIHLPRRFDAVAVRSPSNAIVVGVHSPDKILFVNGSKTHQDGVCPENYRSRSQAIISKYC
jgi:hypothetical protein